MYLVQVEHWWLNDYVTVSASVSGELLPTSVTFHEVTQSINLLTAQVLLFRHEIPGTNRRQDTHSLSVSSERRCLRQGSSNLHDAPVGTSWVELPAESAGLLCISDFIGRCGSNLKDPTRKTCCCAENDRFRSRRHGPTGPIVYWAHCSARAHTTASTFHACVKFNLVVNYSRSVFSVQFILFLRQSLFMCLVLWSKSNTKT